MKHYVDITARIDVDQLLERLREAAARRPGVVPLPSVPRDDGDERRRFDACFEAVYKWEGGRYTNHPADPGGPTKHGITLKRLSAWRGKKVTANDVKRLSKAEAKDIYYSHYWKASECDALPAGIDLCVYNRSVNSGPVRGQRLLQTLLRGYGKRIAVDGDIGPETIAALQGVGHRRIVDDYFEAYERYYRSLKTFPTFGKGWLNRNRDLHKKARAML
jgi:lysozyme family protein